jgi:AbiJ N-terminal domain 4
MQSFSQRKGLKPVRDFVQIDGMSDDLRNGLWNVLDVAIWSDTEFLFTRHGAGQIMPFSRDLWFHFFKRPIDRRPANPGEILKDIRSYFFQCSWNEVYDFLEYIVRHQREDRRRLPEYLNMVLDREVSGYRFVAGTVTDITDEQEVRMLEDALSDSRFAGVAGHLKRSLELFSNRESPDYRNSIKESVSAVESMAKVVTGNPKATLPDALKALDKQGQLHPALREGFIKLYSYTSDEHGIRHAMLELPNLSASDARFFLLSCTSFVNYLKTRIE